MMPGFPNLWTIYGPNTNGGLTRLLPRGHRRATRSSAWRPGSDKRAIEVPTTPSGAITAWSTSATLEGVERPAAHNYYWTEYGRSAVMCPFYPREPWHLLRHPSFDDLIVR